MNKDDLFKVFLINDLMDLPNAVTKILDMDLEDRNKIYRELIRLNDNDLSYDWFQEVYESDLSERKQKKQDFTPNSLGVLCSLLTSVGYITTGGKILKRRVLTINISHDIYDHLHLRYLPHRSGHRIFRLGCRNAYHRTNLYEMFGFLMKNIQLIIYSKILKHDCLILKECGYCNFYNNHRTPC